jgi:uncharacterized protein (DUF697 family)/tellurite resistance protein
MTISTPPTEVQEEALVAICLFAAFADGEKSDPEHTEVRRLSEAFGDNLAPSVTQKILTGRLGIATAAATLTEPSHRLLAYEMAVGVCEADGAISPAERTFLDELRTSLSLAPAEATAAEQPVGDIALAPLGDQASSPDNGGMILRYAIVNGALELLPDTLATMAIIPLQMKMVYRIGKSHGVALDTGHIKEFLATAGIGMTSQVVEGFARKFAKQLAKKFTGKTGSKIADQATGSAFSFGSTYALGFIADQYYAGGRTMLPTQMREGFQNLLTAAREKHATFLPQIQEKAKSLDPGKIFTLLRDPAGV